MDLNAVVAEVGDGAVICRCEAVLAGAVRQAISDGATTINDVKRSTRAGMGICQGIFCTRSVAALLHTSGGQPMEDIVPMTARPPARPVPLEALAATEED